MKETVRIELTREDDGRSIVEAVDLPGVIAYGSTQEEARAKVENLARQVLQELTFAT